MSGEIFVQHILGYGVDGLEEERRRKLLTEAGFHELKSEPDANGKRWVIWYLPGAWAARGSIKGFSTDSIGSWLMREIGPGEITMGGKHWGLSCN